MSTNQMVPCASHPYAGLVYLAASLVWVLAACCIGYEVFGLNALSVAGVSLAGGLLVSYAWERHTRREQRRDQASSDPDRAGTLVKIDQAWRHADTLVVAINGTLDECQSLAEIEATLASSRYAAASIPPHLVSPGLFQLHDVLERIYWRRSFNGIVTRSEFSEMKNRVLATQDSPSN